MQSGLWLLCLPEHFCYIYFVQTKQGFYWHITYMKMAIWQWASYQIRKIAGCACAGNAGNVFPSHRLHRKPLVSDPDMHHGTCVTHVPWCMSGSLTRGGGENVPGISGACTNLNFTYLARGPLLYESFQIFVESFHLLWNRCGIL